MFARISLITLIIIPCCAVGQAATAVSWDFTTGIAGWRDEAVSTPQTNEQGTLWPGSDQGLSLRSPDLKLPTQAFQVIELALSTQSAGPMHLLWQGENQAGTATGWQGALPVQAPADGQMHEVRLLPLWQDLRAVTGLRLIGPPGLQLRLRSLRIVGHEAAPSAQTEWQFDSPADAGQWLPLLGAATLRRQAEGLQVRLVDPEVMLASPPLQTPAYRFEWLSLELSTSSSARARLQWATTAQRGLQGPEFALRSGRHTYNVHCGNERSWSGQLAGLALVVAQFIAPEGAIPFDAAQGLRNRAATEVMLHSLRLSNAPQGPADLRATFAGPVEPRISATRPFKLVWVLQNEGGQEARSIAVSATGDGAISIPPGITAVERLPHGMPQPVTWLVRASGAGVVRLRAEYDGRVLTEEVRLEPVEPVRGQSPDEPVIGRGQSPIRPGTDPLVLAHYHGPPRLMWGPAVLDRMLYRRPYLGDYDLQPEVIDWQVKWALEHGLSGFIVDVRAGGAGALDAFLGSRLARQAKLCLRWSEPTPTAEAARQLLDDFAPVMAQPNYVRDQGKPLLFVGQSLQRSRDGWGVSDLQAVAAEGQAALVACLPLNMAAPELLQKAGYVAAADLHTEEQVPVCQPVLQAWEDAAQRQVPHVLSLQPAWQGELTPERLQMLLRVALLRAQRTESHALPLVIAGDWNGEQGLEPRRPEGTQWLEAVGGAGYYPAHGPDSIRPLLLPMDVGMGPYDRGYPSPPRAWEFDSKESWTSAMGLSVLRILNGQLTGRTDSNEPAIFGGETMLDTRPFRTVLIGMAVSAGKQGRLYWKTNLRKFTVEHSLPFAIVADGAVHEYRLDMGGVPGWAGYLEGLRLDPTDVAGAAVALDYVRIVQ